MQKILHNRIGAITTFLAGITSVNAFYLSRNPEFFDATVQLLKQVESFFEKEGIPDVSGKVSCFSGELETIKRGFHPVTFEKMSIPKRELQYALTFKITDACNSLLAIAYHFASDRIEQARELIENILLVAIQNKIIVIEELPQPVAQQDLEKLWQLLSTHEALNIIQKKALLLVHLLDCFNIMDTTFDKLRNVAAQQA